ncbi:MAG: T9SS type A sorting domain-containing protein [Saprospiraceae bacterium]
MSTEELNKENNVSLFPNPASGITQLQFTYPVNDAILSLSSVHGELVFQQVYMGANKNIVIDISKYPVGVYVLNVRALEYQFSYKLLKTE